MVKNMDSSENYNIKYDGYVGIDECSRGNVFGPCLFVGVSLKVPYTELSFAVDSKTTTKEQRKVLYSKIIDNVDYHLVKIPPQKIDADGLSKCIKEALDEITNHFNGRKIVYDGKAKFGCEYPLLETEIKADSKVVAVSCASIIAKYNLDLIMEEYHKVHPQYCFNTNAGYGTEKHIDAIKKYGFLPDHRMSYNVKELEYLKSKNSTSLLF
jgi:ribonuclease HII